MFVKKNAKIFIRCQILCNLTVLIFTPKNSLSENLLAVNYQNSQSKLTFRTL